MNLDSLEEIKKLDRSDVYGSVCALPQQIEHAWQEVGQLDIPSDYASVDNIVMCGMGGSGLGARVIESLYTGKLSLPLIRVNDYHLPGFVNQKSLVVCSSYSGTTEETLNNFDEAKEKQAKILVISTGKTLIDKAKAEKVPFYQINPLYNPSNQPRMAIGYSIMGQIALMQKAGLLTISESDIQSAVRTMKQVITDNQIEVSFSTNLTKELANRIYEKILCFISAEHLVGATHVFNNQVNENSKNSSFDFFIPELNHHLMESLRNPEGNKDNLFILFVSSKLYSDKIEKRFEVTEKVVSQNQLPYSKVTLNSDLPFSQAFELIQFGAFVNFYLAMLYGLDPAPIPWVDYFKEELKK